MPDRADSLAVLFRRVHGAYAQAVNAGLGRSGHLWQNRFYACPLSERHLWVALRYVEANAVRAGLVAQAAAYRWSSAAAHLGEGCDPAGVLDGGFWERSGGSATWKELHEAGEPEDQVHPAKTLHVRGPALWRRRVRGQDGRALPAALAEVEFREGGSLG